MLFNSSAGEAVVKCQPYSMKWTMELWTKADCIKFLQDEIQERWQENRLRRDIRFCEDLMIKKLDPCLNIAGAHYSPEKLPPRLKKYYLEKQAYLNAAYDRMFNQ
jgi:hypothetical protein